jgi:hypothetical protein
VCTKVTLRVGAKYAFEENVRILVARGKSVSGVDWEHGGLSETVEARRADFYKRVSVCGKDGAVGSVHTEFVGLYVPQKQAIQSANSSSDDELSVDWIKRN